MIWVESEGEGEGEGEGDREDDELMDRFNKWLLEYNFQVQLQSQTKGPARRDRQHSYSCTHVAACLALQGQPQRVR